MIVHQPECPGNPCLCIGGREYVKPREPDPNGLSLSILQPTWAKWTSPKPPAPDASKPAGVVKAAGVVADRRALSAELERAGKRWGDAYVWAVGVGRDVRKNVLDPVVASAYLEHLKTTEVPA